MEDVWKICLLTEERNFFTDVQKLLKKYNINIILRIL